MYSLTECDRDEGDWVERANNAFQSYMEWLPLRHQEGSMGVINKGSFRQHIEWGDLASFVTFDTRISVRSDDPTLNGFTSTCAMGSCKQQ